jgi:hypothetical protein
MTDVAPSDQRKNSAIRQISHAGFEALMAILDAQGFEEMVRNLRTMGQVEAVMRKSPAMVGMLIALAWKFREQPLLSDMFKNAEGNVIATEDEPIAPCGRTFDDIRHAHLLGTARLYLTQRAPAAGTEQKSALKVGFSPGSSAKSRSIHRRRTRQRSITA